MPRWQQMRSVWVRLCWRSLWDMRRTQWWAWPNMPLRGMVWRCGGDWWKHMNQHTNPNHGYGGSTWQTQPSPLNWVNGVMRFTNGNRKSGSLSDNSKRLLTKTKSCLFWFMLPERTSTVNFHACRFVGFVQQGPNIHRTVFECAKSVEETPRRTVRKQRKRQTEGWCKWTSAYGNWSHKG